jgi:hypothetical protein
MARVGPTSAVSSTPPVSPTAAALRVQTLVEAEATLQASPDAAPTKPPQAQTLKTAIADAASRQGGLAPLMADLEQAMGSTALPAGLKAAISQVLSLRTPLTPTLTAADIKQAVSASGVFLEPRLAADVPARPDMKAALLVLRQMLQTLPAASPPAPQRTTAERPPPPPPPFKGDIPHAQRPVAASLSPDMPEHAVLQHLQKATLGAIARTELLQFASLPDAPRADAPRTDMDRPAAWMFEVPFLTAQGAAIAQFKIERDGGEGGAESAARGPIWRSQFSIDLEPLGPIHAQVTLSGGQTVVTLWAERPETAAQLNDDQGELAVALGGAEVAVYPGSPRAVPPPAGQFVDRST